MYYSILLPKGVCQRPLDQSRNVAKPLCVTVFCCPGVSVRCLCCFAALLLLLSAAAAACAAAVAAAAADAAAAAAAASPAA